MTEPFANLPRNHYGAILADPPWRFEAWYNGGWRVKPDGSRYFSKAATRHYPVMRIEEIAALPLSEIAAKDCVLFLWVCWPILEQALGLLKPWGFKYKTCGFNWIKANALQLDMLRDDADADMLLGYWTRANSEVCLLATRGKPKRLNADVRQGIIAPRREHSRKPDGIHERIERLVAGPYLELFARQKRKGWDVWGNQTDKFEAVA